MWVRTITLDASDICFLPFVFDIHTALCIEGVSFVLASRVLSTRFTRLVVWFFWLYKRNIRFQSFQD